MNAGLKSFRPPQPHKISSHPVIPSTEDNIKFPSLAELNAEIFDWQEGEEEIVLADHSLCADIEIFSAAAVPPPPILAPVAPRVPGIGPLTASILASVDKLFFVSYRVPGSAMTEWALVRVDLQRSIQAHPAALQDGRFLVDFYTCHPADRRYNVSN